VRHRKRIEVRWRDMDAFRHVNNAAYLTYLEEARDEWMGLAVGDDLLGDFVLARVKIDYRSPVTQDDDEVEVEVALVAVGGASLTTSEIVRAGAEARVAAEARSVLVHIDAASGRSRTLGEELRTQLVSLLAPA
jgi:acyl-CoA thioester hydrolase